MGGIILVLFLIVTVIITIIYAIDSWTYIDHTIAIMAIIASIIAVVWNLQLNWFRKHLHLTWLFGAVISLIIAMGIIIIDYTIDNWNYIDHTIAIMLIIANGISVVWNFQKHFQLNWFKNHLHLTWLFVVTILIVIIYTGWFPLSTKEDVAGYRLFFIVVLLIVDMWIIAQKNRSWLFIIPSIPFLFFPLLLTNNQYDKDFAK